MKKSFFLLCLILTWAFMAQVFAASGNLDPAFGPVGFVTTSLSAGADRAYTAVRQADGKLVLAGIRGFGTVAVVRYNPNGALDPTFDGDGIVTTAIAGATQASVVIQPDGKIVVGATGTNTGYAVIRYNSDGSLDQTFDGDGIFTDSNAGTLNALAIQPDGKIVTAGNIAINFFSTDFSIVRLNANGSYDTSFDGDGKAFVSIGDQAAGGNDYAYALALQVDGKIVVGGESDFLNTGRDFSLARLNPDGSLDATFDGDGKVKTAFGGSSQNEAIRAIAVQTDGRIVVAGYGGENSVRGFALARYNSDGSLDTTFDGDGKIVTPTSTNGNEAANGLVIQPDGKIIAAGYSVLQVALVRYNSDGSLDTSFSGDGKVLTEINPNYSAQARAVLLEPNGKIIIAGSAGKSGVDEDFLLARYNADGVPSPDLGTFGYVVTNPFNQTNQSSQAQSVAVQKDGKIVVGANRIISSSETVGAIIRYTADGALDSSFAPGDSGIGIATISIPGAVTQEVNAVAVQPDGKILAVGTYEDQQVIGLFIVQLNTDGSRNTAFGGSGNGFALYSAENGGGLGQDIALQADGKIVVGGAAPNFATLRIEFAAFRFNADGSRDLSFGTSGLAKTPVSAAGNDLAAAVAIQSDGKIVLAGAADLSESSNSDIALVRFNANGTLDGSFGSGGKIVQSLSGSIDLLTDVQLQADGKIVAAGTKCDDNACSSSSGIILRYTSIGTLDATFDGDGMAVIQIGQSSALASLAVQTNGKIVASGSGGNQQTPPDALVVRLQSDGSVDTAFGTNGFIISDIGGTAQESFAVVLQPDGKIVSAGYTTTGTREDVAVWRYLGDAVSTVRQTKFDFDGDGKADVAVFRPSNGTWYVQGSANGFFAFPFGTSTDKPVPADYDGDGKTDIAVFRGGVWYLQRSRQGFLGITFGQSGDIPQPADYDGDGKADIAVFRPSNGTWYVYNLANGQFSSVHFGSDEDQPVVGDYDGDGRADYAVFRAGYWYLLRSSQGFLGINFGFASDTVVPADYDGDGKTDIAVFRGGIWYLLQSGSGFVGIQFGISADLPVPADYDGDGKADIAVVRSGIWYLQESSSGFQSTAFGFADDKPIPNVFIP